MGRMGRDWMRRDGMLMGRDKIGRDWMGRDGMEWGGMGRDGEEWGWMEWKRRDGEGC